MTALLALYRLLLRQQVTVGRLALVGGFGILVLAIALGINRQVSDQQQAIADGVSLVTALGIGLMVPIVSLVLSSSTLGELIEDETIVYLWHRPLARWKLAVAAWLASASVAIPLTTLPLALAGFIASRDASTAAAIALATGLASLAYGALFVLLGLLFRRALIWGLIYLFIWELFVANVGGGSAQLSIRTYPLSVLARLTNVDIRLADHSLPTGVIVPIVVALIAVGLTAWRLDKIDVA